MDPYVPHEVRVLCPFPGSPSEFRPWTAVQKGLLGLLGQVPEAGTYLLRQFMCDRCPFILECCYRKGLRERGGLCDKLQ